MQQSKSSEGCLSQVIDISRGDRWLIYHRLQELMIPCACPADGTLRVDVNHAIDLILVRSTVQQFVASRNELVNWLEQCWYTEVICQHNH